MLCIALHSPYINQFPLANVVVIGHVCTVTQACIHGRRSPNIMHLSLLHNLSDRVIVPQSPEEVMVPGCTLEKSVKSL